MYKLQDFNATYFNQVTRMENYPFFVQFLSCFKVRTRTWVCVKIKQRLIDCIIGLVIQLFMEAVSCQEIIN